MIHVRTSNCPSRTDCWGVSSDSTLRWLPATREKSQSYKLQQEEARCGVFWIDRWWYNSRVPLIYWFMCINTPKPQRILALSFHSLWSCLLVKLQCFIKCALGILRSALILIKLQIHSFSEALNCLNSPENERQSYIQGHDKVLWYYI